MLKEEQDINKPTTHRYVFSRVLHYGQMVFVSAVFGLADIKYVLIDWCLYKSNRLQANEKNEEDKKTK